jgi:hypothetical protein
MKRATLLLLAALAFAGSAPELAAQAAAVPRIHPADPHRLMRNGATWFPLGFYGAAITMATGESAWHSTVKGGLTPADHAFRHFADRLAANDLNYFRAWIQTAIPIDPAVDDWDYFVVHPYLRSNTPGAIDGGNKFDLDQFNPAYFALLQRQVDHAAMKGLVAQLILFDCWPVTQSGGPTGQPAWSERDYFKQGNNMNDLHWTTPLEWFSPGHAVAGRQKAFVREVMAAIGNRPNIIWETCNEDLTGNPTSPTTAVTAWDLMIASEVDAHGSLPYLVMPRDLPEHRTVAGHRTPAPNSSESIAAMHSRLVNPQFGWNLPLITDNDCCAVFPDLPTYLQDQRHRPREKAWAALTAGAHTNYFIADLNESHALMTNQVVRAMMKEVGYVSKFLRDLGVNLVGMTPSDALVQGGTGSWAYARSGDEYVIYLRDAGPTTRPTVTVQALPAAYAATWFNPREGSALAAAGGPTFQAPAPGDWALHIRRTAPPPVRICQQPVAQTALAGGTATFQVAACDGVSPYSYRWQKSATGTSWADLNNGGGVSGAFSPTLTVSPVAAGHAGYYRARATDSSSPPAQATSQAAQLSLPAPCVPGTGTLCLQNGRFKIQATYVNGGTQVATAAPYSQKTGFFWFARAANLEIGVKVLQGFNAWWVFHGPMTTLEYTLTVTDTATGGVRVYHRPAGGLCGGVDVNAFPLGSGLAAPGAGGQWDAEPSQAAADSTGGTGTLGTCTPSATRLCQLGGRFAVQILRNGVAQQAFPLTTETGLFAFGAADNGEVTAKVLDGRPVNNRYWVFWGSMSDQAYSIVVTDTVTGAVKTYSNPQGNHCGGSDINAFPG